MGNIWATEVQESRKGPLLEVSEGAWSYWHMDFDILAYKTVRE